MKIHVALRPCLAFEPVFIQKKERNRHAVRTGNACGHTRKYGLSRGDEAFFHGLVDFLDNQGVASAVAAIPAWFMKENVHKIVEKIKSIFAKKDSSTDTKKNFMKCIDYLSQFCTNEDTIKLLIMGLNDRTVTKKGDEGSYVRTEALQAIPPLLKKKPIANAVLKDVLKLCLDRISDLCLLAFTVLMIIFEITTRFKPQREFY